MNISTRWNLGIAVANLALGIYLATLGDLFTALVCGTAGAYNLAIWKASRP